MLSRTLRIIFLAISFSLVSPVSAQVIPQIPEIPAFLPTFDQVPATQAMPLDGTWLVSSIRKKIRIEAGRAYAVDSWLHLFTLRVEPTMVVIKNITPTAPGQYSGEDLPLLGKWKANVNADRSLSVSVAGLLGPVQYKLIPVQLDDPQWYLQEMNAAGLGVPAYMQQSQQQSYQPSRPTNEAQ